MNKRISVNKAQWSWELRLTAASGPPFWTTGDDSMGWHERQPSLPRNISWASTGESGNSKPQPEMRRTTSIDLLNHSISAWTDQPQAIVATQSIPSFIWLPQMLALKHSAQALVDRLLQFRYLIP